ncbi:hypothetical protein DYB37_001898 [Aphanomyces astaci]|uniref:Protein kinase domain-containing protein n=1 Tax=Aphanomyces astaci TaxID=112090 RepID=A0A3R7BJH8_APHAT|nr:hypothetical protein DYB35_001039 [Aphanomyces astaci]RHZ14346.1 hypothetical protein DYB37_001898 [Aphanomyces astaci]
MKGTVSLDAQLRAIMGPQITEEELLKKFTFEGVIGNGATATVYAALDHSSGERVAIKVFDKAQMIEVRKSILGDNVEVKDTAVSRVQRRLKKIISELSIAKALDHANIIRYIGAIETSHRICIVHELIDGHDMLEYVLAFHKMDEPLAAHCFDQLLRAIHACHDLNVWHRDVKLENVLLTHDFQVKLIDFGLSERTADALHSVCGTPLYCSPELLFLPTNFRDEGVAGAPADVWSTGILLFAVLTGCSPFDDSSFSTLRQEVYRNSIKFPSHLSELVQDLLASILTSDPAARPTIPTLLSHPWLVKNVALYRSTIRLVRMKSLSRGSFHSETEDSSDAASSLDDAGASYRDLLYDQLVEQEDQSPPTR